jgi:tetratricopeptide (TPR) repeat protein
MKLNLAALLLMLLFATAPALAQDSDDEVDFVELAALLMRDGEADRAAEALARVDLEAEGVDLVKYHTVRGLIALEKQQLDTAAEAFDAAVGVGQTDPLIHLYRAQAYFGLERYQEAIDALDAAGEQVQGISGAWLLRAHALWMQDQKQAALSTLSEAGDRFPGNTAFLRRQVFYLVEAGLYQEAADLGRVYLQRAEAKAVDYAAIGSALRRSKSFDEALRFLQAARLKFPQDGAIARALAQTWLESGRPLAAAEVMAAQAELEPELLVEAAELYRRAGRMSQAINLNARVTDGERKYKQRVALLIAARRFAEVTGMEGALRRAGLFEDEDLRYALAYAWYRIGGFSEVERHLQALTRPELFRKATELRRLMQECADTPWACA